MKAGDLVRYTTEGWTDDGEHKVFVMTGIILKISMGYRWPPTLETASILFAGGIEEIPTKFCEKMIETEGARSAL